jgi:hypothetical protein
MSKENSNAERAMAIDAASVLSPASHLREYTIHATRCGWRIDLFFITRREESIWGSYLVLRYAEDKGRVVPAEELFRRLLNRVGDGKKAYRVLRHPC